MCKQRRSAGIGTSWAPCLGIASPHSYALQPVSFVVGRVVLWTTPHEGSLALGSVYYVVIG